MSNNVCIEFHIKPKNKIESFLNTSLFLSISVKIGNSFLNIFLIKGPSGFLLISLVGETKEKSNLFISSKNLSICLFLLYK